MSKVAVIGLGTMGCRIAAALAGAGNEVKGFDLADGAVAVARDAGVTVSGSEQEAVADAEIVVLSLPRPVHVIAATRNGLRAPEGALVVDLSTIDPGSARQAQANLADRKIGYVDAPVLGRPESIGKWTLACGGTDGDLDRVEALMVGPVARKVARIGEVGSGSVVKILNNMMFGAINATTAEALNACQLAGVDPAVFVETVAESGAATVSNLFRELAPKIVAGDYDPAFSLALLSKDVQLALDLQRSVGAFGPIAHSVAAVNEVGLNNDLGDMDTGVVHRVYRANSRGGEPR
ncbi:hypothetical protein SA2016_0898 [Sinomonas atrocyanea]|uniref:3-hydroxyisobutyrate dehydrogenase n=1 Tax=Sinomonas atrocyanea TaxID=37927 RepID=A0A126ZXH9_9MICC|nr:NAD(P)-dependent oxidoreductase [Sinomonas atrocyanea]AMM31586.1 hypothetical protein SA2016_0898 [Sinomonas atrocyanea]GEB66553.1 3-hydroxyisobutyrate dehydrogenase [Sinomonas atrocyanea]GGG57800.1 3-hydroxyisobutyrate dehydrogenase [Sinomonas atrocyanea]